MPTRQQRNEQRSREIERITNRVNPIADRLFDGDVPKGFLFWAADLHLDQAENRPTEDDLLGNITDGKDDLELDAYYVDDDATTVYLFQSKYRSQPGNLRMGDLASFLDVPNRLATPKVLAGISNEQILDFAPTFRRALLDGYDLQLVYLTTLRATKSLQNRANGWSESGLILRIGGVSVDVPHFATVIDIDYLTRVMDSLNEIREIELTLKIASGGYHKSSSGGLSCLIATLGLNELAKTFDEHRYAIFRFNPRGPLGAAVAVNKEIKATLENQDLRDRFQLMNNGLSAVCTAFTVSELHADTAIITVRDFQIVNGCQTTYSVYDHWRRGGNLGDATVTLKLVEDPSSGLRREISAASNKQSQMKDWDFLFDQSDQERLHREFQDLVPPVFYELRRGQYKYMSDGQTTRRVTVKDIAQTMWAFVGKPGEAKDKLRDVPRSKDSMSGAYREVFSLEIEAERLWLPWLVYERVQAEWKSYSDTTGNRSDEREHGRLHVLWLVGRSIVRLQGASRYQEMPIGKVRRLTETVDEWFPEHHRAAVDTLSYVVDVRQGVAEESGYRLQLRQLFRSAENYEAFEKYQDRLIEERCSVSGDGSAVA